MISIENHIENLTKPLTELEIMAYTIEDLTWERDVYLEALTDYIVAEVKTELGKRNK